MNQSEDTSQNDKPVAAPPHATDAGRACAAGAERSLSGAKSCNTAPSNCMEEQETLILRSGIDSLYLSYPGQLGDEAHIRLERLKGLSQNKEPGRQALAQYETAGHLLEVLDRGSHPYKYVLRDYWYYLKVAGLSASRVPLVHAQLASHALTLNGPVKVEHELNEIVKTLGTKKGECAVSRADLCVDFVTRHPLHEIQDRDWVSRAKKVARRSHGRKFSGYVIGEGGPLSARLYDKTLEIEVASHKTFFYDLWHALGWDGVSPVWRLEFQFKREVLRSLGVKTFPQLMNSLGGLWAYATQNWLRLTRPTTDKTQSRWPTHPWWATLQGIDWGSEPEYQRVSVDKTSCPGDKYLFVNGLSGLTSFMAREGITDPPEGAKAFFRAARAYHDGRRHFTGLSFDEYVMEKVAVKVRQYGTLRNTPADGSRHPADQAVADEYRRRSDGE